MPALVKARKFCTHSGIVATLPANTSLQLVVLSDVFSSALDSFLGARAPAASVDVSEHCDISRGRQQVFKFDLLESAEPTPSWRQSSLEFREF